MTLLQMEAVDKSFFEGLVALAARAAPQFVAALALLIAGVWLSSWLARQVGNFVEREPRIDPTLRGILEALVRYTVLIVVLVAALGQLGVQTTSILAALGAAGLAIGLALQGTLSNIAAGIMLLWLRPYRVNDYIDAGGVTGTVKNVGLFATELHSWDGIYQFVPNSELWNKRVINYNRLPTRLVELKSSISYSDDIDKAKGVLLGIARADNRVHSEPEPAVFVSALKDSSVEISLRVWVSTEDYWATLRTFNEQSKMALEAAEISIPFPQLDVHLDPPGAIPADTREKPIHG